MKNTNNYNANNFASGLLFCAFVVMAVLKFARVIDWSWWIITFPIYIQLLVLLAVVVFAIVIWAIALLVSFIVGIFSKKSNNWR